MKLLRTLILRPLLRDRLRTAITILAVALGVAVVVAIDLAADAAAGSFRSSIETLSGKTDFEIFANGRIDERWFGRLATLPVDARFAAVLEAQALVPGIGAVPLYGVDMLGRGDDDTVLASAALAKRLPPDGLFEANVEGHTRHFRATAMKRAGPDEFLLMDIAACQEFLDRYGKLDRIDVTVAHGEDRDRVERTLRATLPAAYLIEKPGARSQENEIMLRAFRLESARSQLYLAAGGGVPDLQHHFGERGAAARRDRHLAGHRRRPRYGVDGLSDGGFAAGPGGRGCGRGAGAGCLRQAPCGRWPKR